MTTYPLATLGPTVTSTGITAPALSDIIASLQANYQLIYGTDTNLDPSTQDGQWIAIQAQAIYDCNQACIAVYNQFSPATAQGTGLSSVVKINGISRLVPSYSTANITVVGQAGTVITNGVVGDNQSLGTRWDLPTTVTIPGGGSITVTATCETPGAVAALANTLTMILTPTAGWQTANNASNASPGAPVESDATLRQRQASSTALPSMTIASAIAGALENLAGVTAVNYDDNDTGSTDANGVPAHTLAFVVEGGTLQDIVNTIGLKKAAGIQTYGSTSGTYTDAYGIPHTINYSVATQERIVITVQLHALTGYSTAIATEIQNAVAAYINALGIGKSVLISRLYAPALLQGPYASPASPSDLTTFEIVSVAAAIYPASPGTSDITIAYNQIANCQVADITISVV